MSMCIAYAKLITSYAPCHLTTGKIVVIVKPYGICQISGSGTYTFFEIVE